MTAFERRMVELAMQVPTALKPKEGAESLRQWQIGREREEREYQQAVRAAEAGREAAR